MTKAEEREVDINTKYALAGHKDIALRGFETLIRSTRSTKTQKELVSIMGLLGLVLL